MKKADIIKLLQAMSENNKAVAKDFIENPDPADKRDDRDFGMRLLGEACGMETVVLMLNRPGYAEALWKIYFPETEKEAI